MTFHGNSRLSQEEISNIYESPKVMIIPLVILAIGSIFSGLFLVNYFVGSEKDIFWQSSIVIPHHYNHHMPFIQTLIIKFSIAFGVVLAAIMYFYKKEFAKILVKNLNPFYKISLNKWYIDELYDLVLVRPLKKIGSFFWKTRSRGD